MTGDPFKALNRYKWRHELTAMSRVEARLIFRQIRCDMVGATGRTPRQPATDQFNGILAARSRVGWFVAGVCSANSAVRRGEYHEVGL